MTNEGKVDPKVKEILKLLGAGAFLTASFVVPGASGVLLKEYKDYKQEKDAKAWKKFNLWRLKQV